MIATKRFSMKLPFVWMLFLTASFASACIIVVDIHSPQNLGNYIVNTTIPINLSIYDAQSDAGLTTAVLNVSFFSNNTLIQNVLIPYQNGFYNSSFTPLTTGGYEAVLNVSNSSCSNFSGYMNFFVFGSQSISVPDTNILIVLLMFVFIVGYFKWNRGLKNTRLKK